MPFGAHPMPKETIYATTIIRQRFTLIFACVNKAASLPCFAVVLRAGLRTIIVLPC